MSAFVLNCLDSQTSSSNVCNPNCRPPDRYLVSAEGKYFADGGSKTREGNLGKHRWKSGDRLKEKEEGKLKNRTLCEYTIGSGGRERAKDQKVHKSQKWQKGIYETLR